MELKSIKAVMFDLDGTVYYGSQIIAGANNTIAFFRKNGIQVFFTTNNSTMARRRVYERLIKLGVDCKLEEVLTSGYLATVFAKNEGLKDIHIFGSVDLILEFEAQGIKVNQEESAENLLIGYDPNMTYEDLTRAIQVALHANKIIACNRERVFPGEKGRLMPGCGAMTAPIEWCANRQCDLIIGKPNTMLADYLCDEYQLKQKDILVVGDTYESDILMAKNAGCQYVLIGSDSEYEGISVPSIAEIPSVFD